MQKKDLLKELTTEDMVGQLLCYDVYDKDDVNEVDEILRRIKPGGIFIGSVMSAEKIKHYTDVVNSVTKLPVIVASDIPDGPGNVIAGEECFSSAMGRSACGDIDLIKKAGALTAKACRKQGFTWNFAPVVDMAENINSPTANMGVSSDNADDIIAQAGAFAEGLMEHNYVMPTLKHFPDGAGDDRNPHFCTVINRKSREEWDKTDGRIYKTLFERGVPSVMIGHVSLPAYQTGFDNENDALPATLSKELITDLLKGKLGFKGCVVSDAMSMIGAASRVDLDKLGVEFIKAGGDMILFPESTDFDELIKACKNGEIPEERLKDAVSRIIFLKGKARLFENQEELLKEINYDSEETKRLADEIAEKSIKFVRNQNNILPLELKKDAKILMCNLIHPFFNRPPTGKEFSVLKEELERRGYRVDSYDNIGHKKVREIMDGYDAIIVNSYIHPGLYHGGTLRIGWDNIMTFWRGYILKHPKLVFVSFGDPYKLYDFPYLKTYVNAFSESAATQRAVVKVLLGEKPMTAKNPVSFKGFFEKEI